MLRGQSRSGDLDLRELVGGYRHVRELRRPDEKSIDEVWYQRPRIDRKDTLVYGRMFLPRSTLEAMYLRRLSSTRQLQLSCVSDSSLQHGGTILALLQQDYGKFNTEYLYSTDSGLLGARALYNFGPEAYNEKSDQTPQDTSSGRLSAGGEVYYGLLNKSGGASAGMRFTTLPHHTGFPYTMTLTLNPLMGNLSSSYAVKAGGNVALCSQFDFNFYSYESDLRMGCEIWRRRQNKDVEWARKIVERSDWKPASVKPDSDVSSVVKARWDQNWRIELLWEGRLKEMLFSVGVNLDLKRREQIIRGVGAELQFSS